MQNNQHAARAVRDASRYSISIIAIGIGVTILFALSRDHCDKLTCIRSADSPTWKERTVYEHTARSYRALLTARDYMIRVEKYSHLRPEDAALLTKVNTMKIVGLFDDAQSPYPGVVSDRITCDTSYKPEVKQIQNNGLEITYYAAWLNDRLQFGSCLDSQLPFKSYNTYFYCPQEKALYHVEWITQRSQTRDDKYMDLLRTTRCHRPLL